MKIEKIGHYSITNHESVYDEEAMTALELAGRTAKKVNQVIDYLDEATSQVERIPEVVNEAVEDTIKTGAFDEAINEYAGDLEARLDNLIASTPEGSTTMDVEIIDARSGADGYIHVNLGEAIRKQYIDVKESADDKLSAQALEYGYRKNLNHRELWLQGWLSEETGQHGTTGSDYNRYICTKYIPKEVERVVTNGHPMEVFVFSKTNTFLHKVSGRRVDYTFDHSIYNYRIHVTAYTEAMGSEWTTSKNTCNIGDYKDILFLADRIDETPDTVSASAEKLGYKRDLNRRSLWTQGYLYGATGLEGIDPTGYDYWLYNRTDYLPAEVEKIAVDGGYKARLFKYDIRGNFIGYETVTGVSDYLDTSYKYRVDLSPTQANLGERRLVNDVWDKLKLLADKNVGSGGGSATGTNSPFKTDAVFKPYAHEYINVDIDELCEELSTDYAEFFNVCPPEDETIGNDSGGAKIPLFRFKPPISDANTPKIVVVGGQHGFEKGSVLGLIKMVEDLKNVKKPPILRYVELIVIPCLSPSTYNANTYKNVNGVNLNRNYSYAWKKESPDSDYYGGEAPFDQPETRALRDLILKERPDIVIDFHSMGSGLISDSEDIHVYYACGFTDPYYMKLKSVVKANLINFDYSYGGDGNVSYSTHGRFEGFDGTINNKASLDNWCAYDLNTLSLTVEGFNGDDEYLSGYVIKSNTEIILNFICEFLAEYSRG